MRIGKLPPELLGRLLSRLPRTDPRVLVGSAVGEDAAVIDFLASPDTPAAPPERTGAATRVLVAKTDPITFATDRIGWYAVHVNANDVACTGATPRWFLATALLPDHWNEAEVSGLFDQLLDACRELGITLVGGHTEVTAGLDRPIVAGCMLGEAPRAGIVRTGGGRPGDCLILTQGIAIEGTAVLAREAGDRLRARGVAPEVIERAAAMLFDPGISVVRAAQALCAALPPPALHSLHDPTEGGLATGVWEVAEASGTGAAIELAAITVCSPTRAVCDALGLDPLGLLASGALLAAITPDQVEAALDALRAAGVPAAAIGRLTPREEGLQLILPDGSRQPWPRFERDEVARYFDEQPA